MVNTAAKPLVVGEVGVTGDDGAGLLAVEERVAGDEASGKGFGWCRVETMAAGECMDDDVVDSFDFQVTRACSDQTMRL